MMFAGFKWWWILLALFGLWFLGGCADSQLNVQDTLTVLQAGNADGHLVITSDGHPLAFTMNQVFAIGPRGTISFDGDVNFGEPAE